ncbi:MAG: nucleotide exchange factor GrpE [Muribaculaceae bacterium]|jgi:molecular chaperone GrpE|nr:nucleotide exchange factor GrpE [Muribaculaceae bacterium]
MSKNRHNNNKAENAHKHQTNAAEEAAEIKDVLDDTSAEETDETETEAANVELQNQLEAALADVEKEKKEYLFLMAEFDNYRKRVTREKADIIKNAAERVLLEILPIVDDFERALAATADSTESLREGMTLIYHKLIKYLERNGVKPMDTDGKPFDPDFHEAIAKIPAPSDELKGKVVDTTTKGYMLNDKVLRHAKVAVGE